MSNIPLENNAPSGSSAPNGRDPDAVMDKLLQKITDDLNQSKPTLKLDDYVYRDPVTGFAYPLPPGKK